VASWLMQRLTKLASMLRRAEFLSAPGQAPKAQSFDALWYHIHDTVGQTVETSAIMLQLEKVLDADGVVFDRKLIRMLVRITYEYGTVFRYPSP
jgi:hypothetical protein